ncbi:hypothetical protein DEU56DRAFT_372665 [Suillus clintonianus]|uniref:uncharacterized protein n=1 Tax=Suillus clintonianus TaxID=1904413 RepID=UPI001B87A893|nr:uncharacterized protein DEU56DRAFT_372665 [Suillus clintonianus]KAG2154645.1 hypothetical protein DEU56DRAFT_372665 [Suillus clintonianus]
MALNWGAGRHKHQSSYQHAPSAFHDERVPGYFPSPSSYAAYQHHNPNPYAIVSPASFTPDFDQSPSSYYHLDSPPSFSRPLSMTTLNDPAFSSDPCDHPYFPLVSSTFYKEVPSKSPLMVVNKSPLMVVNNLSHTPPTTPIDISPHQEVLCSIEDPDFVSHSPNSEETHPSPTSSSSVSLDSDSHTALSAFTSPTVSSATSHSHSLIHPKTPRVVSPLQLSFPFSASPASSSPSHDLGSSPTMCPPTSNRPIPTRNLTAPEQRENVVRPATVRFDSAPVHADGSNRPTGKRRMKNFIRRFTKPRALDRIDEMDETDPFGAGWHHGGPYEAIGSNLAQLGPAHMYNDIDILRGDFHTKSKRENVPRQVRTQKGARVPQTGSGVGRPSLNFVPGQIIPSGIISPPLHTTQANTVTLNPDLLNLGSGQSRPSHSRSHSSPLYHHPPEAPPSRTSSRAPASQPPSRIHRFGDDIPHIPQHPRPAHDELAPYPLYQIHSAPDLPPGHNKRYPEIRSQARGDANQATPFSSPPIVEPPDGQVIDLAIQFPRHHRTHSLGSSRTRTTTSTQSTSGTQNSLQPPRNSHLPKRLVMPAPLQPQQTLPQQEQYLGIYPRADPYDPYADPDPDPFPPQGYTHEPAAMYHQGRKLLRKKTAVFPGNIPLPMHAPGVHADANPPLTKHPSLSATEVGKVKEVVHRRRLSKRKHDI